MANTQTTVPIFTAAQVLEAAQLNNSAATGVPVFANTTTRDAGFGGAGEKALAEGQLCYLESTNVVQYYDGAAWATVGPAPAASSGLTLITSTSFSSVATVTVSSAFSATYKNYKILINNWSVASGTPTSSIKLGTTATNYVYSLGISGPTSFLDFANGSGTGINMQLNYLHSTNVTQMSIEVLAPFLSQKTFIFSECTNYQNTGFMASQGSQTDATSFTAFTLLNDAATNMSGTIEVYGYAI